jgi:LAO/AO transport system kinase
MPELTLDPGVFIRSMASRGAQGGLARAAGDASLALDAFGCGIVILETVGAGQAEVAVAGLAQTVIAVVVPQLGDEIQAIKAGVLEVADILVVNKADHEGAERAAAALLLAVRRTRPEGEWLPPILQTVATTGKGVPELLAAMAHHRTYLQATRQHRANRDSSEGRARATLEEALKAELLTRLVTATGEGALTSTARRLARHEVDVATAVRELLTEAGRRGGGPEA